MGRLCIPLLVNHLKIIYEENFKNFNFWYSDNRYKENHVAENRIKKLVFIQKLCQFIKRRGLVCT